MSVEYDHSSLRDYWRNFERHKAALEVQSREERRERIATAILAGLVTNPTIRDSVAAYVQTALALADAMIEELDKRSQQ